VRFIPSRHWDFIKLIVLLPTVFKTLRAVIVDQFVGLQRKMAIPASKALTGILEDDEMGMPAILHIHYPLPV
jgi:hypothetical protein